MESTFSVHMLQIQHIEITDLLRGLLLDTNWIDVRWFQGLPPRHRLELSCDAWENWALGLSLDTEKAFIWAESLLLRGIGLARSCICRETLLFVGAAKVGVVDEGYSDQKHCDLLRLALTLGTTRTIWGGEFCADFWQHSQHVEVTIMIKNGFSMIFNRKSLNDSSPFFQAVLFQIVQELVSVRHDLLDFHSFSMPCKWCI